MRSHDSSCQRRPGDTVHRRLALAAALLAAVTAQACSSAMDVQVVPRPGVAPAASRGASCDIRFDERESATPPGCTEIADAWFGDTGFSVNCDWERVSGDARRKGCELGADVAQVVWNEHPGAGSTCFQIRVRYLSCVTVAGGAK